SRAVERPLYPAPTTTASAWRSCSSGERRSGGLVSHPLTGCIETSVLGRAGDRDGPDLNAELWKRELGDSDGRPRRIVAREELVLHLGELLELAAEVDVEGRELDHVLEFGAGRPQRPLETLEREPRLGGHSARGYHCVIDADLPRNPDSVADSVRLRKMKVVVQRLRLFRIYE